MRSLRNLCVTIDQCEVYTNWSLFSQAFDVIKNVLEMFLIFSVIEHVEIKLVLFFIYKFILIGQWYI